MLAGEAEVITVCFLPPLFLLLLLCVYFYSFWLIMGINVISYGSTLLMTLSTLL